MQISIRVDTKQAEAMLKGLQRDQIPAATMYALTQTAKAAQREVHREMSRVFDRPTRYTLGSVWVKPAKKTNLVAEVKIQDTARDSSTRPVQWLIAEIEGGARRRKGFEVLLQGKGVMPSGWYAIPTRAVKLDAYGNVSAGTINQILSQLQARNDYNLDRNESAAQRKRRNSVRYRGRKALSRYFSVMPGGPPRTAHLHPGIWERINAGAFVGPMQGGNIRPVFLFVQSPPKYRRRLRFDRIVRDTVDAQLGLQFKRGLAWAMRTAR